MRQHFLSVIFVACAMLSFGGVVAPERAMAQQSTSCGAGDGGAIVTGFVLRISANNTLCVVGDTNSDTYFTDSFTNGANAFDLLLPGSATVPAVDPVTGNNNSVKFRASYGNVKMAICSGASIDITDVAFGTLTLADGASCELYVFWDDGNDSVSFSGGTLRRDGNVYSIDGNGELAGGEFGGTAVTRSRHFR